MPIISSYLRTVLLLIKIISTLQPCITEGMNAAIVYPVLTLAVVEFTLAPEVYRLLTLVLLCTIHGTVLALAVSNGVLCARTLRSRVSWEEHWEQLF